MSNNPEFMFSSKNIENLLILFPIGIPLLILALFHYCYNWFCFHYKWNFLLCFIGGLILFTILLAPFVLYLILKVINLIVKFCAFTLIFLLNFLIVIPEAMIDFIYKK